MVAAPYVGGGAGLAGRLAANTALGAGFGATQALKDQTDIGKGTITGAGAGLALGGLGEIASKFMEFLPKSLVTNALKKADPEAIDTALSRKFTTVGSGLTESENNVKTLSQKVDSLLSQSEREPVVGGSLPEGMRYVPTEQTPLRGDTVNALQKTVEQFPQSNYTQETIASSLKRLVPDRAALVDKVMNGTATLLEKNQLKQAVYARSYSSGLDKAFPELTAQKQIGRTFSRVLKEELGAIANVPDAEGNTYASLMGELEKEIPLRDALEAAFKQKGAGFRLGLNDIVAFLSGNTLGGIPGGIATVAARRTLQSPSADILAARALQGAGLVGRTVAKSTAPAIIRGVSQQ